jgi:hypothetical protein
VFTGNAIVISAVAGKRASQGPHAHGLPENGDLLVWRSADGGRTWSSPSTVNDVAGAAREGLHAMATGAGGLLFTAWLDLREGRTKLYGARSTDGGVTWSKNVLIYDSPDGTICQCCHPSIAAGTGNEIYVMWRNVLQGARDMYLARSTDAGVTFADARKLGEGTWPLTACPMDGGGVAMSKHGLTAVWRRDGSLYLTTGPSTETRLDTGKDAAIVATSRGIYAAWSSGREIRAQLPGGSKPVTLADDGAYVQLAALPNGDVVAAWESHGSIAIRLLSGGDGGAKAAPCRVRSNEDWIEVCGGRRESLLASLSHPYRMNSIDCAVGYARYELCHRLAH